MSTQTTENNKRIAKNTIILYARTLFVLAVKLYTSRLILKYLGVTDYGIYNIVASFIAMFTLLNGALTTSIQRFLTFSLGERNEKKVQDTFSASLIILLFLSLLIVLVAETIGLWYVNYKLNIPPDRIVAANWVYQLSLATFVIDVITVPYNSILTAYENFKAFAYFDILNTMLALVLVFSLSVIHFDQLIYYGFGLFGIALLIRFLYSYYCHRHYETSHFHIVKEKALYKSLFSFSFYSFFGNMGSIIGEGGVNIVINLFFGVALNATRGISTQVSNAVTGFIRSFTTAVNPQITKKYAEQDYEQCSKLVIYSAKFSFLLLSIFVIPVIVNVEWLLRVWLTEIPPFAEIYVQLMLVQASIHVLFNSITTVLNASGRIKAFQIGVFIILMSNIGIIYALYSLGYPPYMGVVAQCFIYVIQLLFSMILMDKIVAIKVSLFSKQVLLPSFLIFTISLLLSFAVRHVGLAFNIHSLFLIFIAMMITIGVSLTIGTNKPQRQYILNVVKNKIKR